MLYEIHNVAQTEADLLRRWFDDEYFDLVVWCVPDTGEPVAFHLSYDRARNERTIAFNEGQFKHWQVDAGDRTPMANYAAMFTGAGDADADVEKLARRFEKQSQEIELRIAEFVIERLKDLAALQSSNR